MRERINVRRRPEAVEICENPFKVQRKLTDIFFLIIVFATFTIWLAAVFIGLMMISLSKDIRDEVQKNIHNSYDHSESAISQYFSEVIAQSTIGVLEVIIELLKTFFNLGPVTATIGILLLFACVSGLLRVVRWRSRGWSLFSLFCIICHITFTIYVNVMILLPTTRSSVRSLSDLIWNSNGQYERIMISDGEQESFSSSPVDLITSYRVTEMDQTISQDVQTQYAHKIFVVVLNFVIIFYSLLALISLEGVKLEEIEKTLKNIFRIFFYYYRVVYVVMIMFSLQLLILFLSSKAFAALGLWNFESYLILFTGLYLNNVMLYYMLMVIAQLTATWHWAIDEARVRSKIVRKSMACIARYHMGTVAFNASVIFPILVAILVMIRNKIKLRGSATPTDLLFVFYLLPNIMDYSTTATALKGECSSEAIYTTYLTYTRNSKFCLSFIFAFKMTMILITCCITEISGLPWFISNLTTVHPMVLCLLAYNFYGLILQPYIIVLNSIDKANLFCAMENDMNHERIVQHNIPMIRIQATTDDED